ncbi:MAG: lamin tail domain-containing protein [Candidatus Roizmanbacteria bacterium]
MKHNEPHLMLMFVLLLHLLLSAQKVSAFYFSQAVSDQNVFTATIPSPSTSPTVTPQQELPSSTPIPTVTLSPEPTTITPPSTETPTPTPSNLANHLVINEVQPIGSASAEWVELYNPTDFGIDVTGWSIEESNTIDIFPQSVVIPSKSFALIVGSAFTINVIPPNEITIKLSSAIGDGINEVNGHILLRDSSSSLVDQVSYGTDTSAFPSPPPVPATGKTLSRIPDGKDTDTSSDWVTNSTSTMGGSNLP